MAHFSMVGRTAVVVHSFADGSRVVSQAPPPRREPEKVVFARALWLENHGKSSEASMLLEDFLQGKFTSH